MAEQNQSSEPSSSALRKQPSSKYCFVCGVENRVGLKLSFFARNETEVEAEYVIDDQYQGYPGIAHGGILATIMDELAGRSAMIGEEQPFRVTAKLEARYRKPVPTNQPLKLKGRLVEKRGRIAVTRAEIWLPDGSLGAEAEVTLVDWPRELPTEEELEELGWKVYPD